MLTLEDARKKLVGLCKGAKMEQDGVHAVTFQPLPSKANQDRVVSKSWQIAGQTWLFLAICDGHGGPDTAEYTAKRLPDNIREALLKSSLIQHGATDRRAYTEEVSNLLTRTISRLDKDIGSAVEAICPDPNKLTDEQARCIVREHSDILRRAYYGTTLVGALVNRAQEAAWVLNLGDSTVALSLTSLDGTRTGERLVDLHKPTSPTESFLISLGHTGDKTETTHQHQRLLGSLGLTRAIGHFSFKFDRSFYTRLFAHLPSTFSPALGPYIIKHNISPPYLNGSPTVRYMDLGPCRGRAPFLLLFSDGVDILVEGRFTFRREDPCMEEPAAVAGALLGDRIDPHIQSILGHGVESKWRGCDGNRAIEMLGNLLGGVDAVRLSMTTNPPEFLNNSDTAEFYIDDTSIIICDVFRPIPTPQPEVMPTPVTATV